MSTDSLSSTEGEIEEQLVGLLRKKVKKMEARIEHQQQNRYKSLHRLSVVFGIVLFVLVLIWCVHYRGGLGWTATPSLQFNWHPILMTLGMVLMYSQSILIYRTGRGGMKKTLKLWHGIIHLAAFIYAVIGLKAVFDFHNNSNPPIANMYSLHSWLGLLCVIIFTIQLVGGFFTFLLPYASNEIRAIVLPVHVAIGSSCFVLSITVSLMGLTEKAIFSIKTYSEFPSEGMMVNFIGVILAIYGILVLYLLNEPAFKRVPVPEDEQSIVHSQ